jgi:hypothetical protein
LEIMTADRNEYDFAQACAASGVRASPIRTSAKHATRLTEANESLANNGRETRKVLNACPSNY